MKKTLTILLFLYSFHSNAQGPATWNINSSYTHPALVIDGTTTYISLKDVPSGISITSNSYWSTLDSLSPSIAPSGLDSLTSVDASEIEGLTVPPSATHDNFYFGFSHIKELGASDYLLNSVGIKEYSEWQSPPLTYFGPSANGNESTLTYKFQFSGSIISAKARINLSVWNFNAPGAFGSGQGSASAWASADGQEWVNLINLPVPQTFSSGQTFEDMLPESVLGTKEIYLQIRMEVSGAPNSSYTTAQFGRSDANALKDIFYLDANYTSSVSHSDGLIAYYPFDGNASDMSGNNNHGVVFGATLSEDRYGRLSHAYNFDGDDWIELPHNKLLNGQSNVTIAAWYKLNNGAGEGQIISSGDYRGGNDPIHLRLGPSGSTQFSLHNISTSYTYSSMNSRWYHLAVVLKSDESSSQLTVFINGENIAYSEKTLQVIYYDVNMPTIIGALEGRPFYSSPGQFFNGSIDDVRIYNRAFTSTEIDELFESEKPKYPSSASFFDIDAQSQNNEVSFSAPKSSYYKVVLNALPDAKFDVISYWSPPNQWMSGFQYSVDSGSPIDHRFGPFSSKEEAFSAFEDLVLFLDEGQVITFSDPDYSLFDNSGGTSLVLYPIIYNDSFDPSDGLVAYYPFDGNASDMSGNGNDGTVYGATLSTDRNGDANKAYSFDGVNDYIKVGGPSALTNGENQTISVWVKGSDIGNPIYWDDDTQSGGDMKISIHEGSVIRFKRTGNVVLYTTDTVDMSNWNHIVVSFKDDTTYKIYINGSLSLKEDLVDNLELDDRTHISIGSGHNGYQGFFNGSIDEVRHYVRTLSDREVAALYELERPHFDFAHCMEKLPGGSLIAIPKGYAAPGGLTLKSRGEEYDLYEVTGMVTTMEQTIETGKSLGRIEGKSEVLANPSAYGLFTESDLNSTRENAWSEGQMIGKSFGELSVINQPGSFGLKSLSEFNNAKSNSLIDGHSEILGEVVSLLKSISETNNLEIPDSLRNHSYSDFFNQSGAIDLKIIELAIEQFIDFADSAVSSPYTTGWFYSRNLGWMWTDKTVFPYFFRSDEGWIYFKKGFNQPRFFNYDTKSWFEIQE